MIRELHPQGSVTTVGATTETILDIDLSASINNGGMLPIAAKIVVEILAANAARTKLYSCMLSSRASATTTGASIVGGITLTDEFLSSELGPLLGNTIKATMDSSGMHIRIRGTGKAGETLNWIADAVLHTF